MCVRACVLLPLQVSAPMPLGVLSRFWMQPDIITAIAVGKGLVLAANALLGMIEGSIGKASFPAHVSCVELSYRVPGLFACT